MKKALIIALLIGLILLSGCKNTEKVVTQQNTTSQQVMGQKNITSNNTHAYNQTINNTINNTINKNESHKTSGSSSSTSSPSGSSGSTLGGGSSGGSASSGSSGPSGGSGASSGTTSGNNQETPEQRHNENIAVIYSMNDSFFYAKYRPRISLRSPFIEHNNNLSSLLSIYTSNLPALISSYSLVSNAPQEFMNKCDYSRNLCIFKKDNNYYLGVKSKLYSLRLQDPSSLGLSCSNGSYRVNLSYIIYPDNSNQGFSSRFMFKIYNGSTLLRTRADSYMARFDGYRVMDTQMPFGIKAVCNQNLSRNMGEGLHCLTPGEFIKIKDYYLFLTASNTSFSAWRSPQGHIIGTKKSIIANIKLFKNQSFQRNIDLYIKENISTAPESIAINQVSMDNLTLFMDPMSTSQKICMYIKPEKSKNKTFITNYSIVRNASLFRLPLLSLYSDPVYLFINSLRLNDSVLGYYREHPLEREKPRDIFYLLRNHELYVFTLESNQSKYIEGINLTLLDDYPGFIKLRINKDNSFRPITIYIRPIHIYKEKSSNYPQFRGEYTQLNIHDDQHLLPFRGKLLYNFLTLLTSSISSYQFNKVELPVIYHNPQPERHSLYAHVNNITLSINRTEARLWNQLFKAVYIVAKVNASARLDNHSLRDYSFRTILNRYIDEPYISMTDQELLHNFSHLSYPPPLGLFTGAVKNYEKQVVSNNYTINYDPPILVRLPDSLVYIQGGKVFVFKKNKTIVRKWNLHRDPSIKIDNISISHTNRNFVISTTNNNFSNINLYDLTPFEMQLSSKHLGFVWPTWFGPWCNWHLLQYTYPSNQFFSTAPITDQALINKSLRIIGERSMFPMFITINDSITLIYPLMNNSRWAGKIIRRIVLRNISINTSLPQQAQIYEDLLKNNCIEYLTYKLGKCPQYLLLTFEVFNETDPLTNITVFKPMSWVGIDNYCGCRGIMKQLLNCSPQLSYDYTKQDNRPFAHIRDINWIAFIVANQTIS